MIPPAHAPRPPPSLLSLLTPVACAGSSRVWRGGQRGGRATAGAARAGACLSAQPREHAAARVLPPVPLPPPAFSAKLLPARCSKAAVAKFAGLASACSCCCDTPRRALARRALSRPRADRRHRCFVSPVLRVTGASSHGPSLPLSRCRLSDRARGVARAARGSRTARVCCRPARGMRLGVGARAREPCADCVGLAPLVWALRSSCGLCARVSLDRT